MSSTLKILVDIQCFVYCDFEQVGEAIPNSIFKIELRKGTYILEFKIDGTTIVSKEYIMKSDNEEDLLRINLSIALSKYKREQKCLEIANKNADIQYEDGDWWIVNKDNGCRIRLLYNLADHTYSHTDRKTFDMVGLRSVNIGGEKDYFYYGYFIIGGKWGCINKQGKIQIPIIYDTSIYFFNEQVASTYLNGEGVIINKYGETVLEGVYDSLIGDFRSNQMVKKSGKYGAIDVNGCFVVPAIYDKIERFGNEDREFIVEVYGKKGVVDIHGQMIVPIVYDNIIKMIGVEGSKPVYTCCKVTTKK